MHTRSARTLGLIAAVIALSVGSPASAQAKDTTSPSRFELYDATRSTSPTITLRWGPSSDSGSGLAGYEVWVNDEPYRTVDAGSGSITTGELADGWHTWRAYAIDNAGNRTATTSDGFEVNAEPPTVTRGPALHSLTSQLNPLSISVYLTWDSESPGGYIDQTQLWHSVDGGPWETVADGYWDVTEPGHTYRWMARVTDRDGRQSTSVAGEPVAIDAAQEDASAIRYTKEWRLPDPSEHQDWAHFGATGQQRTSRVKGASATYSFTGRQISWVSPTGKQRGKAKVYVDGVLTDTVDTWSRYEASARIIVFTRSWTTAGRHTIKIVNLGTKGRSGVGVDAFLVLN